MIGWLMAALACVGLTIAVARAGRLAAAEARIEALEVNRLELHAQLRAEYGVRQCMVTVARGDYDDFLRQLGWQRGGSER